MKAFSFAAAIALRRPSLFKPGGLESALLVEFGLLYIR